MYGRTTSKLHRKLGGMKRQFRLSNDGRRHIRICLKRTYVIIRDLTLIESQRFIARKGEGASTMQVIQAARKLSTDGIRYVQGLMSSKFPDHVGGMRLPSMKFAEA